MAFWFLLGAKTKHGLWWRGVVNLGGVSLSLHGAYDGPVFGGGVFQVNEQVPLPRAGKPLC